MTAEFIARGLQGRKTGAGWIARCPAHDDSTPSLSVRDSGGRVLVHCHTGCSQDDLIAALRSRGLWPEREKPDWTPAERASWAAEQRETERDLPAARYWKKAAVAMIEDLLDVLKAGFFDPTQPTPDVSEIRRLAGRLSRIRKADGADLVTEYRWWWQNCPGMTAAMVDCARRIEQEKGRALLAYLREMESKRVTA